MPSPTPVLNPANTFLRTSGCAAPSGRMGERNRSTRSRRRSLPTLLIAA